MKNIFRGLTVFVLVSLFTQPVFAATKTGGTTDANSTLQKTELASLQNTSTSNSTELKTKGGKDVTALAAQSVSLVAEKHLAYVPDEVIVKFKESQVDLSKAAGISKSAQFAVSKNLSVKENIGLANIAVLKTKNTESVEDVVARLQADPDVEYAQPNYQYYPMTISSNDTLRGELWALENTGQTVNTVTGTNDADIDAKEAWDIAQGNTVIVAVIDSGVAYNHPDLAANMWNGAACVDENGVALGGCNHGYDFQDNDKTPLPTITSHGTHIAGIIAATMNNSQGVIGVAPQAKIMALKTSLTTANNVAAINFAKHNGAKVINASWAGQAEDPALKAAIDAFPGVFIAAAGNGEEFGDAGTGDVHGTDIQMFPCDFDSSNIICVTATDQDDTIASFADYGATSVDIGAPGENIFSTIAESAVTNETFESVTPPNLPAGWVKDGDWGTLDLGGQKVLYATVSSSPSSPYATGSTAAFGPTINLSGVTDAKISFITHCDTEYSSTEWLDFMVLYMTNNGTDFTVIHQWDEQTLDNNTNPDDTGPVRLIEKQIPVSMLTSNFGFAFQWNANATNNAFNGCFVDSVKITKVSDGSDGQYDYAEGTSMAAPYVAGAAALLYSARPDFSTAAVKNAILENGDANASLAGKTISGKRLNVFNALSAVESGTLVVKKVLINDDGGTAATSTFSFKVNDGIAQAFEADGENVLSLPAGTYSVTEVAASGYTTTYSGCSNIAVAAGATSTCVITNDDVAGDPEDVPFTQGIVSLTFDDGWQSFAANAHPVLNAAGLKATAYINSEPVQDEFDAFMSSSTLRTMHTNGYEIGGHTTTHAHLIGLNAAQLDAEIDDNRAFLESIGLSPVANFAYPYGEYNAAVRQAVIDAGYNSARTVDSGYNFSNADTFTLKIQNVTNLTTPAEIQTWIDTAVANKTWLILMFHEIVPEVNAANCEGDEGGDFTECSSIATLQATTNHLVNNAVCVLTVAQALAGSPCSAPVTHTISAAPGANGGISPSGSVSVHEGADQSFTITPASGYHVDTLVVDSVSVATSTSYTFVNVQADHTIFVSFAADIVIGITYTALESAIANAQAAHDSAVEGTQPGEYPTGSKATLQAAIDAATDALSATEQSIVDAAVVDLNAALDAFLASVIVGTNQPPTANNQSVTVNQNASIEITLVANDLENAALTWDVGTPEHGTLSSTTPNTLTYTPAVDYFGSDSFTFKVSDGTSLSNVATVSITVNLLATCPTSFHSDGEQCVADSSVSACPTGYSYDIASEQCQPAPQPFSCPAGSVLNETNGQCEFPNTIPQCPAGFVFSPTDNLCHNVIDPLGGGTVPATCPAGSSFNAALHQCVVPSVSACATGFVYTSSSDQCVPNGSGGISPSCPVGTIGTVSGGECTPNPIALTCPAGYTVDGIICVPATTTFTLSATASGPGTVSCDPSACETTHADGTVVTVTASPSGNAVLSGWSTEGCTGSTCVVTIHANTTVTATFACSGGFHLESNACVANPVGGGSPPSSGGGGGGGGGGGIAYTYSVKINNDAPTTTSRNITLTIAPAGSANQMQVSNTSDFASSTWITFQQSYPWTLTAGDGSKTVYVRYGSTNSIIATAQDSIVLSSSEASATFQSQVLGASTSCFQFTRTLSRGMSGNDVLELQKILVAGGFLTIDAPTNYFGAMTETAVKAFQAKNGLEPVGVVGPKTRALLNACDGTPTASKDSMTEEQKQALIEALKKQLEVLLKQIADILAARQTTAATN